MLTSYHQKVIYSGTGRRKRSVARVNLIPGSGKLIINNLPGESYLQFSPNYLRISFSPLSLLGLDKEYDVYVKTTGGGLTGQADAIRLGLARALCTINSDNRIMLKSEGLLRRDARSKERKNMAYGKQGKLRNTQKDKEYYYIFIILDKNITNK